jgi:hypothetical protein
MSENKPNWSRVDALNEKLEGKKTPKPAQENALVPILEGKLEKLEQPMSPQVLSRPMKDINHEPNEVGFFAGLHGEGKVKKKAIVKALELKYNAEIDTLEHRLTNLVRVRKVQAEVVAEGYLKQLDAAKLEVLTQLGMRNVNTRQNAMVELTNATVAKIKEVESSEWPESLKNERIHDMLVLLKGFNRKLMEELGEEINSVRK